jgi:uncharacterized tellurite resistance protein B-like protein
MGQKKTARRRFCVLKEASMDTRLDLFHNLVNLAAADCRFTDEELEFLAQRAERWGVSTEEFDAAIAGISTGVAQIDLPRLPQARRQLLREMIRLMAADGELAEIEKRLCAVASAKMDFSSQEFEELLESVLSG